MPLNHPITPALLADPEIFQQNRLPFHAHFADQTSPELSLTVSLDGEWNFRYAENLTAPFTDWDTLTVPGFIRVFPTLAILFPPFFTNFSLFRYGFPKNSLTIFSVLNRKGPCVFHFRIKIRSKSVPTIVKNPYCIDIDALDDKKPMKIFSLFL